jgi:MoaA/NifB/PqqE/SkfB family radical SAM enzyme
MAQARRMRLSPVGTLATDALVRLGEATNRTFVLPLLMFYPTGRCNSRCVSCDWWKHNGADDLTLGEIDGLAAALPALGTRVVVFSGGEPLLRPEVFDAAQIFRARGMTLHLLTSGVLLDRCADRVAQHFARVVVSLDATSEPLYQKIRGVDALGIVERGIVTLRRLAPEVPVTARATLHRLNFRELPRLVDHAKALALDGISFLPADMSSAGFGRASVAAGTPRPDLAGLALDREEVREFEATIEHMISTHAADFVSGFIVESPDKLRRLPRYYAAAGGDEPFPRVACNAPWVSVVVEADGSVRPCFFQGSIGSIRQAPIGTIVTDNLRLFREAFDVGADPVCVRCVCSLKTSWRSAPWRQ